MSKIYSKEKHQYIERSEAAFLSHGSHPHNSKSTSIEASKITLEINSNLELLIQTLDRLSLLNLEISKEIDQPAELYCNS